jgi:hypothetical protein
MVVMTEGDQRLEQVDERIGEARDAAEQAEPSLFPDRPGTADSTGGGAFEPSGDDREAGENPSEGRDSQLPGDLDDDG